MLWGDPSCVLDVAYSREKKKKWRCRSDRKTEDKREQRERQSIYVCPFHFKMQKKNHLKGAKGIPLPAWSICPLKFDHIALAQHFQPGRCESILVKFKFGEIVEFMETTRCPNIVNYFLCFTMR